MSSFVNVEQEWSALLGATLEICIHHLLFARRVYPKESFTTTRFMGIGNCRINRHVQVSNYIATSLKTVVSTILSGAANQVLVKVIEHTVVLEQFVFQIKSTPLVETEDASSQLREMEKAMRDLVLRIHSLEARETPFSERKDLAFKICLVLNDPTTDDSLHCDELTKALSENTWFYNNVEFEKMNSNDSFLHRPLQRVSVPRCGLQMDLVMVVPNDKTKPPSKGLLNNS